MIRCCYRPRKRPSQAGSTALIVGLVLLVTTLVWLSWGTAQVAVWLFRKVRG